MQGSGANNKELCDLRWMKRTTAPKSVAAGNEVRVADLFAGCGGMSLGAAEALRQAGYVMKPVLAIDAMEAAMRVYRANFGVSEEVARACDINEVVTGDCGDDRYDIPQVDLVLAGPPCQGHSDLNNHTRREDARNSLYLRVVRYAELAKPSAIIIENVPGVRHATEGVVDEATRLLEQLGYGVTKVAVDAYDLGLPQRRKRFLLVAARVRLTEEGLLRYAGDRRATVGQYIKDLEREHASFSDEMYRTPSGMSANNKKRAKWLFDNDEYNLPNAHRPPCHRDKPHSYVSMYGRMYWNEPAQTITTGFGSMGQGRYLHPKRQTVITPHEAARLQGFPDFFDFSEAQKRTELHTMIGNAVPPRVAAIVVGNLVETGAFSAVENGPQYASAAE